MEKYLEALVVKRKTGKELFHLGAEQTPFDLLGFWQWSGSDLSNNVFRGMLAEYIVACDLGAQAGTRTEWDAYDLMTSKGVRVEVKSAAYIQSWYQKTLSPVSFQIRPTRGWDARTNTYSPERKRQADVYVFCLLKHKEKLTLDPLNLKQWEFYVLTASVLNERLPNQQSIRLASLLRLNPLKVEFGDIGKSIDSLFK